GFHDRVKLDFGTHVKVSLAQIFARMGEFRLRHGPTRELSRLLSLSGAGHRCANRVAARASTLVFAPRSAFVRLREHGRWLSDRCGSREAQWSCPNPRWPWSFPAPRAS